MDDFISYLMSKPDKWSEVKIVTLDNLKYPACVSARHVSIGLIRIVVLNPHEPIETESLPLPCALAFSSAGDDTDAADYLQELRGPKRKEENSPYLIYNLTSYP